MQYCCCCCPLLLLVKAVRVSSHKINLDFLSPVPPYSAIALVFFLHCQAVRNDPSHSHTAVRKYHLKGTRLNKVCCVCVCIVAVLGARSTFDLPPCCPPNSPHTGSGNHVVTVTLLHLYTSKHELPYFGARMLSGHLGHAPTRSHPPRTRSRRLFPCVVIFSNRDMRPPPLAFSLGV